MAADNEEDQFIWIPDDDAPVTLEDVEAYDILAMAKDRALSRVLQRSLLKGGPEVSKVISERAEPHIPVLVLDQFGNYLVQKVLEVCGAEFFERALAVLLGAVQDLAFDPHGTRALQKLIEQAVARGKVDDLLTAIPAELTQRLARHGTGYHVAGRLVESLPAAEAQNLIESLCGTPDSILSLGKDQWGCCVLKKCIDRSAGACRDKLIDSVVEHAPVLAQDAFGNYVVQHVIVIGGPTLRSHEHVSSVVGALKGHVFELAQHKYSSPVVEKCLAFSTDEDRQKIIDEILTPKSCEPSEAVRTLLFHHYGNYVIQQALETARDPQWSLLVELVRPHVKDVLTSWGAAEGEAGGDARELPAEHARRLCTRLARRYPVLAEGLPWNYGPYPGYNTPWSGGPGAAAPGLDPAMLLASLGFVPGGQGSSSGAGSRGRRPRSKGQDAEAGAEAAEKTTVRVGRVVGFWPNYETVYDEIDPMEVFPMAMGMGGGGRTRKRGRAGGAQRRARAERRSAGDDAAGGWGLEAAAAAAASEAAAEAPGEFRPSSSIPS